MTAMPRTHLLAACLGILVCAAGISGAGIFVAGARAQDSNVKFESGLLRKPPKPGLPDVRPQPMAWPRLDPGAILCRTEDDLDRLAARRHGETISGPVDCQVVRNPTAITIVQRVGPGRVEVKVTTAQSGDTGWTDAWLPDKAPSSGTASASR
jgi:hypothetical protein